ncbi:MAG TPA: DUF1080 domain-containing protein [Bryobacteraceae bacterium]|nr:DUF1080 domain-containing protein [Bryobacteraceae bacterium]
MRAVITLVLFAQSLPLVANAKFNGAWDITVNGEPRRRAWWLGLEGADTPNPRGTFISAYGGDLNVIEEISIRGNDLTFGFKPRNGGHLVYKAKLAGNRLEGTFEVDGKPRGITWTGVRAPVIKDKEDGSWKKGKPIPLFDGKDMSEWKGLIPEQPLGWTVKDGVLKNTPKANNLISLQKFWNFELHVEYKVGEHSNSGIGLRGRYEVQILEDYGRPPDSHGNGALYSRIVPKENASRKAGEWQTFHIRLVGRTVTVVLNGKTIIDKGEIEGLTAVAVDPHEGQPGPLILQGDHGSVEFRKIVLTPLTR